MTEYFNIVPWFNSEEWIEAYDNIYNKRNKEVALELLLVWKARCPSLPSGIESTLTLLEVAIQDEKFSNSSANDQLLRLAYSSAIMRFVNHMLDTETAKGTSLYQAARNLGVPDWIIDLRHDTAHSNNLPSIELLREAAQIGLEWLERNYWTKYKECIKDYTTGNQYSYSETQDNNKVAAVMHFCTSLSFCAHSKCKIKNLSDVPNMTMRESIVNDARDLFGDHYDFSNLKTVSIVSLVNILNAHSKKLLKSKDAILQANQALLGPDSLFLSVELLNFMGNEDFYKKKKLTASYVQCFELLLTFLHSNNMLLDFVLELIQITNKVTDDDHRCLLAALWISEILKALGKSKQFTERIRDSTDIQSKKKQELRSLYHHWFPNEKVNSLLLDMQKSVPSPLTDITFLQPIISTYNPYLKFFIKDLLTLVEPHLPKHVTENIYKLTELISSPDKFPAVSTKIYTIEDLMDNNITEMAENSQDCDVSMNDASMNIVSTTERVPNLNASSFGIWKLCTGDHNWNMCPIGLLPWQ